ncbi:MAG: hypothetical protein GIW94_10230, partial [Candidatus Eremiobacteraeota bacterium]|nr:hypothetical protein [Candidatus Eremiobacteraeota bacterium]MBC5821461.1 hypothetical protein [Candidatus Eremiobacteraeota bacterium]
MRFALTFALALAAAVASSGPAGAASDAEAPVTRVAQRLEGTWECRGPVAGSTSREVYARGGPSTIVLHNAVHTARGREGVVHETFGYDAARARWNLSAPMNPFFDVLQLDARDWRAQQWVFTGTQTVQNVARPTRIIYTSRGSDAYRREHQSRSGGVWQADGAFECRRERSAAAQFVPAIAVLRRTAAPLHHPATGVRTAVPAPHRLPTPRASHHVALRIPVPQTAAMSSDRVYSLIGAWSCRTFGGLSATHTFTRPSTDTLLLLNVLRIGDRDYHIHETFRFDPARQIWSNVTEGGAYVGTAPRWLGRIWVFDGSIAERSGRVPVKMSYAELDNRAFLRRFERRQNGVWTTYAAE